MKRNVLIVIYIIFILFTLKLLYNFAANNILVNKYNEGIYDSRQAESLTFLNFLQNYVAYYNYGNILFQNGEYENAINEYKLALGGFVPKNKECNIRINYALAICRTVQVNEKDQESLKSAIETYKSAIAVLTESGCANKNDNNGHSLKAERLKKDIQKEIDRLKKLQTDQVDDNTEDDGDSNNSQGKSETVEEKIRGIKEDATKKQKDVETLYNSYGKEFSAFDKKNW